MKTLITILFILFVAFTVNAKSYKELHDLMKKDLVRKLSATLLEDNVQVISAQTRGDDTFRDDEFFDQHPYGIKSVQNLITCRFLKTHHGGISLKPQQHIYTECVRPPIPSFGKPLPHHYYAQIIRDDTSFIAFARRRGFDTKKLKPKLVYDPSEIKQFMEDVDKLEVKALLKKYELDELYKTRVFEIVNNCGFRTHVPIVELPVTNSMKINNYGTDKEKVEKVLKWSYEHALKSHLFLENNEIEELLKLLDLCQKYNSIKEVVRELVLLAVQLDSQLTKDIVDYIANLNLEKEDKSLKTKEELVKEIIESAKVEKKRRHQIEPVTSKKRIIINK